MEWLNVWPIAISKYQIRTTSIQTCTFFYCHDYLYHPYQQMKVNKWSQKVKILHLSMGCSSTIAQL